MNNISLAVKETKAQVKASMKGLTSDECRTKVKTMYFEEKQNLTSERVARATLKNAELARVLATTACLVAQEELDARVKEEQLKEQLKEQQKKQQEKNLAQREENKLYVDKKGRVISEKYKGQVFYIQPSGYISSLVRLPPSVMRQGNLFASREAAKAEVLRREKKQAKRGAIYVRLL